MLVSCVAYWTGYAAVSSDGLAHVTEGEADDRLICRIICDGEAGDAAAFQLLVCDAGGGGELRGKEDEEDLTG